MHKYNCKQYWAMLVKAKDTCEAFMVFKLTPNRHSSTHPSTLHMWGFYGVQTYTRHSSTHPSTLHVWGLYGVQTYT